MTLSSQLSSLSCDDVIAAIECVLECVLERVPQRFSRGLEEETADLQGSLKICGTDLLKIF